MRTVKKGSVTNTKACPVYIFVTIRSLANIAAGVQIFETRVGYDKLKIIVR